MINDPNMPGDSWYSLVKTIARTRHRYVMYSTSYDVLNEACGVVLERVTGNVKFLAWSGTVASFSTGLACSSNPYLNRDVQS